MAHTLLFFSTEFIFYFLYTAFPCPLSVPQWRCDAVIQLLTEMFSHIAEYAFRAFARAKPGPGQTRERRHQTYVFTVCQKSKNTQTKKKSGAPSGMDQFSHHFSAGFPPPTAQQSFIHRCFSANGFRQWHAEREHHHHELIEIFGNF